MKLTLNVWERMMLRLIVGRVKGSAAAMHKAIKVLDALEFSEEERKEIGLTTNFVGDISWRPDASAEYEIDIPDKEAAALLRRTFNEFDEWVANDAAKVIALEEKLTQKYKREQKEGAEDAPED